jgi:diguanylate cyclase (GGDEF)-like protein/PAS domain S-box-containing protein
LRDLLVLDSGAEPVFDSIARMAAQLCGTSIALLSLVDQDRQWFKASVGLHGLTETPGSIALCAHTVRSHEFFEVPDATQDPRFSDNPMVTGDLKIRFYAGAPLILAGGECVGTLCVADRAARTLSESQRQLLGALAAIASDALAMRRDLVGKALSVRSEHERALSISESHYRNIVEDQIELISLARPDGVLTYVNPAYARHFGQRPDDMAGKSLFDFIDPSDRAAVRHLLDDVLRTGEAVSSENRMVANDGQERWVAWTNGVQYDGLGRPTLHSVGRDVSARKRVEQALRASQSFLYRTGRAAGVGGWELDLASGAVTWSEETRRIHEVPAGFVPTLESAIGFYAVEARAVIQEAVQTAIDQGTPWDVELPLVTASGRRIWVRAVGSVDHEGGRAVRLTGAFQDVTQRKELEQRVANQAATLSLVTEAIPATVAVVDPEGRYRFVNSAFERWCGLGRDQVIGRTAREVLGEAEFERRWPFVKRAMAGEPVVFELDDVGPEGSTHVAVSYVPLRLETGQVDGFVVVTQDATAQKREALRLLELSQRDPLTGLLNRTGFEQYLERNLLEGGGASLALLYIDLDRFKPVNDQHGHAAGDQVLRLFSQRLVKLVRPTDAVARLGGDEFAVALAGTHEPANAHGVADKVLAAAHAPFKMGDLVVSIGASVGVAYSVDPVSGWADLLERADAKLLIAKAAGKGRQAGETT